MTLLGLLFVPLALVSRGRLSLVEGVLELHGGFVSWALRRLVPLRGGAAAITLGHVVLGRDAGTLERTRRHERAHVRQVERWGPLFLPAYFLSSLFALLRGQHPYYGNYFEREAHAAEHLQPLRDPADTA